MVTHYQPRGKQHSTISIYTGIFNNKAFREGGRRTAKSSSDPLAEGIREDVFSDSSKPHVERCKTPPSLDASSCVNRVVSEKSTSELDVAQMKAVNCTKIGPHMQNSARPNAGIHTDRQYNAGHVDHCNMKRFLDEPCDNIGTNHVQKYGPCLLPQNMPYASQRALRRDVDEDDKAERIDGASNNGSRKLSDATKNRDNLHTRTDTLFQSRETPSVCLQAADTRNLKTSGASVDEMCWGKKMSKSTAHKNEHTLHLYKKPSESNSSSSTLDVSNMSGNKGACPGLHHNYVSRSPKGRVLTSRGQLDGPMLFPGEVPKENSNASSFVVNSYISGEANGECTPESSKHKAHYLNGMENSGDATFSCDSRVYKCTPEKRQEARGRGTTNGADSKGSSSGKYPLEWNLRIGEPIFWDSSSSYGSSSSSGSPMASGPLIDGRSKGSPYSVSSRSMGSITGHGNTGNPRLSPNSSNGSPSFHAQWGIDTYVTSHTCADRGNLTRGDHLSYGRDSVAVKPGSLLNNGNLLVGGIYGNVLSYGGKDAKRNATQGGAKLHTSAVDYSLMKKAQASLDSEDIKNAGNNYYNAGHFSEALTLYDRAISLCPSNVMYRSYRAAALSGLERYGEAVKECEEAIGLDCLYAPAHLHIASLYTRLGLIDRAKQHLYAAGEQTNFLELRRLQQIERHFFRCIEARTLEDWHDVIRESDAAVVAGADSAPQIFGFKAEALLRLHKLEDADSVCSMALKVESSLITQGISCKDSSLQLTRAQVNLALGRFEEAVGAAECAVRIDPSNANSTSFLIKSRAVAKARSTGNDLFKVGRLFEALASYTEGLESDPRNAVLLCNRAACRLKLCQWEKAVEDCDAALRLRPHYTKALLRRASCLTKLECWEDALQDYEVLQRELPGDAEVARGFFDFQVAMKRSRGEEIYGMKFGGEVEEVANDEQFREAVSFPGLSVVQFTARWSDRCREVSPFIDDLCRRHPCVNFVKVDVQDLPYLAKFENINFIPTFKIYKNAKKLKEIIGPSEESLEYAVKHYSL